MEAVAQTPSRVFYVSLWSQLSPLLVAFISHISASTSNLTEHKLFFADESPDKYWEPLYTTLICTRAHRLHSNSFAFTSYIGDTRSFLSLIVKCDHCVSLWLLCFMGSGGEMEELWIHGALNVCVNDQSQPAELERRVQRKGKETEWWIKEKYRNGEKSRGRGGGNILRLMFPFPQPQLIAIKKSIFCPHKDHSSHWSLAITFED